MAVGVVVAEGFWESQRNKTRIVGKGDLCYTMGESSTKVSPAVREVENVPNELWVALKEMSRQHAEDATHKRGKEGPARRLWVTMLAIKSDAPNVILRTKGEN